MSALRRQRACDFCRRRKIRCNPSDNDDSRCASCIEYGLQKCTFLAPTGRSEPTFAYVKQLEDRVSNLEQLLKRQLSVSDNSASKSLISKSRLVNGDILDTFQPDQLRQRAPRSREPEILTEVPKTTWNTKGRVYGQSSWLPLLDLANDLREDAASEPVKPVRPHLLHEKRPAFDWEDTIKDESNDAALFAALPNNNTIRELWEIFARRVLPFWPVLHRPTVEVQISDLLHERSVPQARLILLMAALASIYLPTTHNLEWRPPGWHYFSVVRVSHVELILQNEACLQDVQVLAMQTLYYYLMGAPHCGWIVLGAGIRLAQEVGVYDPSFAKSRGPLEVEIWRRVFWFFISLDRFFCAILGHAEMVREEYLDLEPPRPTIMEPTAQDASNCEYLRCQIQCGRISSFAIRARLATTPWFRAWGFQSKKAVIGRTDELLKQWEANLPEDMQWDPKRENVIHFEQSAELRIQSRIVTILTHNVVEAAAPNSGIIPLTPEDLCGFAALEILQTAVPLLKRCPDFFTPLLAQGVCFGAVVFETRLWASKKRPEIPEDVLAKLNKVYIKATDIMKHLATRWPSIARFFFIIDVFVHGDTHMKMAPVHTQIDVDDASPMNLFAVLRETIRRKKLKAEVKTISQAIDSLPPTQCDDHNRSPSDPATSVSGSSGRATTLTPSVDGSTKLPITLADFDAPFIFAGNDGVDPSLAPADFEMRGDMMADFDMSFDAQGNDSSLMSFVNQLNGSPIPVDPAFSWDSIFQDVQIGFKEDHEGLFSQRYQGRGGPARSMQTGPLLPGGLNQPGPALSFGGAARGGMGGGGAGQPGALSMIPEGQEGEGVPGYMALPADFQFSFTPQR